MTTKITEQNISNLANAGVDWQAVKTGNFTAVAGEGYFVNTTSAAITVTLPASPSAGDVVVLKDYARTWGTNAVSTSSALFDGVSRTQSFSTEGQTATLVYMDGTKGWSLINEDTTSNLGAQYVTATGGTVTTSGDYKIHTFTGDGCFVVSCAGNPGGSNTVDYLVVAGGGSGGTWGSGGGGAGGFRESGGTASGCYTTSPLGSCVSALPVTATGYPITVGGGGTGQPYPTRTSATPGSNSVFSTITSAGGGRGGGCGTPNASGGSGGGGSYAGPPYSTGASGNTPPVSPPQGQPGGDGACGPSYSGGGGGGATVSGSNGTTSTAADGGAGATTSISGSPTAYAGGGGAGSSGPTTRPGGTGGTGGGGPGGTSGGSNPGGAGTTNTGGGGGGAGATTTTGTSAGSGGNGGKGIVIIRYKFQ